LFQNQVLKEKFGDLVGKLCYENYMGRKEPCNFCPVVKAIKNKVLERSEIIGIDGRSYELLSAPLPNPDGKVDKAIEVIRDITELKRAEEKLKQSYNKLKKTFWQIVRTLSTITKVKDPYTAGHQQRVTKLACAIATEMGLPDERIEGIYIAGLLHDIGKIAIPAEILNKLTDLTEAESNLVKTHPEVGYDILKNIEFSEPIAQIVLQHHEMMDGSGYPQGLKGKEILLEARILAVADVVEAISSHRPYRPALGLDKALEEIAQNKGTLYDPKVVDTCLKLFTEKGFRFE